MVSLYYTNTSATVTTTLTSWLFFHDLLTSGVKPDHRNS